MMIFCEVFLKKYKKSNKVKFITKIISKKIKINIIMIIIFQNIVTYGWACGDKLWKEINFDHSYWKKYLSSKEFKNHFELKDEYEYWLKTFDLIDKGKQKSWSIYFVYNVEKKYLTILQI